MAGEKDYQEEAPFINTDRLHSLFSLYKFPLGLGLLGIFLFLVAIALLFKNHSSSSEVIFSSEASVSAQVRTIKIDVAGAVMAPGVYEFRESDRLSDALIAAGGLSAEADREWISKNLNRAAKLTDGGKIYIPSKNENEGKLSISNPQFSIRDDKNLLGVTTGLVNVNTASQTELEGLPGVGPVTAQKITSGRPFGNLEELVSKKAVGKALFEKIKDKLTI